MIKEKHKQVIIPVFISHMGCPNDCIFCNQRHITGVNQSITPIELPSYIDSYLETINADKIELAFFGGSFSGLEIALQNAYLKVAFDYKQRGQIHRIRLSTRPDYINETVLDLFKKYTVNTIELGVQSFDEEVLKNSKRGHTALATYKASKMIKDYEFELGIQLMYGLPSDHSEKFFFSVEESIRLAPSCVRIYPALVIRNTELEHMYNEGIFKPLSLKCAVRDVALAVKLFEQSKIPVIRIGLQRTDLIDFDREIIDGPFHPAFRELVYDHLFFETILTFYEAFQKGHKHGYRGELHVHPKQVGHIYGHKKSNKMLLSSIESKMPFKIIQSDQILMNHLGFLMEKGIEILDVMK